MIGLADTDGALVGFTGRARPDAHPRTPKYLNTSSTAAFDKGQVMFGLAGHHDALRAGAIPVRCEGVFDAIAITRASERRVIGIAPMGTALTDAQADLLVEAAVIGGNTRISMATDQDRAGRAAALTDWAKLVARGIDPRRLVIPANDPAEAYTADGGQSIRTAVDHLDIAPSITSEKTGAIIHDATHHLETGLALWGPACTSCQL